MTDIKTDAITFNMYYGGKSVAEMLEDGDNPDNTTKAPVTEETPIFRNIDIKNCVCNGAGRAMEFNGLPEMPIDGITPSLPRRMPYLPIARISRRRT